MSCAGPELPSRCLAGADAAVTCGICFVAVFTVLYHLVLLSGTTAPVAVPLAVAAAVLTGTGLAAVRTRWPHGAPEASRTTACVTLAAAACAGLLAALVVRPDADDAYYLDRSVAVATTGAVPRRDTIFSDERFPPLPGQVPPVSSVEVLLGALARLLGADAVSVVHVGLPPVVAAASVLALARLLRAWRVGSPGASLVVALGYLLAGGAAHASFGNLHAVRAWQGKVVLVAVVLPYLHAVLAEQVRARRRAPLALGATAAVAAVGCSSTAVMVVPVVAALAAVTAPGPVRRRAALLAVGAYPVVVGVVVAASPSGGGEVQDALPPVALAEKVLGSGALAVIGLAGALAGGLAVRDGPVRRTVVGTSVLAVAGLAAGGAAGVAAVTGAGAVTWRLAWVLPVPALVGAAAAPLLGGIRPPGARAGAAVAVATALVVVGTPLWAESNGARLDPGGPRLPPGTAAAARAVADRYPRGTVLTPSPVAVALTVLAATPHPVSPRADYTAELTGAPGFAGRSRAALQAWADGGAPPEDLVAALQEVGVTAVCLAPSHPLPDVLGPSEQVGGLRCARGPADDGAPRPSTD